MGKEAVTHDEWRLVTDLAKLYARTRVGADHERDASKVTVGRDPTKRLAF
jgi:hypothetical protein